MDDSHKELGSEVQGQGQGNIDNRSIAANPQNQVCDSSGMDSSSKAQVASDPVPESLNPERSQDTILQKALAAAHEYYDKAEKGEYSLFDDCTTLAEIIARAGEFQKALDACTEKFSHREREFREQISAGEDSRTLRTTHDKAMAVFDQFIYDTLMIRVTGVYEDTSGDVKE
jgi:hypothetical protein